jgi:hypothetical protein
MERVLQEETSAYPYPYLENPELHLLFHVYVPQSALA